MRKGLFIFSLLNLIFSIVSNAQNTDPLKNASIEKIYSLTKAKGRPLIVIDGIIYTGKGKQFNVDDIAMLEFLKPPGSTNIYGPQGNDGAILINSKNLRAQDTANRISINPDSTIYVLNGELSSEKELNSLDVSDLLSIEVLKTDKTSVPEEQREKRTKIIITRSFAIKTYQKGISDLSADYRQFLKSYKNNDGKLPFLINGIKYPISTDKRIKKLYELFLNKSTLQDFELHYVFASGNLPSFVEINFKQN